MPLLNYTTTIQATKTVSEIQNNLAKHGAKAVLSNYDSAGLIESLSFIIQLANQELPFRLPVNPDAVLRVLEQQDVPNRFKNRPQAVRIAWRIVKDWVAAQMALLSTEMVSMEQIFLPYIVAEGGKTLYEAMVERKFLLPSGQGGEK